MWSTAFDPRLSELFWYLCRYCIKSLPSRDNTQNPSQIGAVDLDPKLIKPSSRSALFTRKDGSSKNRQWTDRNYKASVSIRKWQPNFADEMRNFFPISASFFYCDDLP